MCAYQGYNAVLRLGTMIEFDELDFSKVTF